MPRVNWEGNVSTEDIDGFDRESQFIPYSGPMPVNGVYAFRIKLFKYADATGGKKYPNLQIGLELVPRDNRPEDKAYKGYFLMDYLSISPQTAFRYVPFLDALGIAKASDFVNKMFVDEDGHVTKIGRWRNTGDVVVLASLMDSGDDRYPKKVNWYGALEEDLDDEEEEEEEGEDYYADEESDEDF